MRGFLLPCTILCLVLAGCSSSLTGLSGTSGYACKAPQGVACDSVSGTYANSVANRLPGRTPAVLPDPPASASPTLPPRPVRALHGTSPAVAAAALRSEPRVLRLWVKPWEDTDGDLVDQSYVHVQIDNGRWLTEHVHRRTREAYAAVKPPPNLGLAKDSKDGTARPALPAPVSRAGTFPGAGPVQQED